MARKTQGTGVHQCDVIPPTTQRQWISFVDIDEFNSNKISDELTESCKKAGKLFKRKESNQRKEEK